MKKLTDWLKEYNSQQPHQQDQIQYEKDFCRCLCTGTHGSAPHLTKTLIIRKENNNEK